jgi:hypothetical protein
MSAGYAKTAGDIARTQLARTILENNMLYPFDHEKQEASGFIG